MNYWVIIPAAGLGLRMGVVKQKQYLDLLGKTLLEHPINIFLNHPKVTKIMVALHPKDEDWRKLALPVSDRVLTTVGGAERSDSVLRSLEALQTQENPQPDDWVLVHDAVRPCLQPHHINRLIDQLENHPVGGILGIPVRDTLKRVDENSHIVETLPRENTWSAQTPQMFRFQILLDALNHVKEHHLQVTDEASAVELLGRQAVMVKGDARNIKVTYPEDLLLAQEFINRENHYND